MDWAEEVAETIIGSAIGWDGNVHASRLLVAIPEALRAAHSRGKEEAEEQWTWARTSPWSSDSAAQLHVEGR